MSVKMRKRKILSSKSANEEKHVCNCTQPEVDFIYPNSNIPASPAFRGNGYLTPGRR